MMETPKPEWRRGPLTHFFGEVESALDTAHELARQGRLQEWDNVLVKSQTSGRGQLRRRWESPPGNLYGALRLPRVSPFNDSAGSVAIGALFANALASFGCPIHLKWPNDLILVQQNSRQLKIGGILLEERDGALIAGIGVNMEVAPKMTRPGAAVDAGRLEGVCVAKEYELAQIWLSLVKHVHSVYKHGAFFSEIWKDLATELLLWRGECVEIRDADAIATGVLRGVGSDGAALLEFSDGHVEEKLSGEMRSCGGNAQK